MIRYSRANKKYFLKKSNLYIVIVGTEPILIKGNSSFTVNTGLRFWLDGGTIALLVEANLPPVLRIANKTMRGKSELKIEIYNTSDNDVILPIPIEICYMIPLASAYFTNIEIDEISQEWWTNNDNIAEN